jgi:hypothetical protein
MKRFRCCVSPVPAGAWSSQLRHWLPQLPEVSGLKVHSIVLADPQQQTTADALFLAYRWLAECCSCQFCSSPESPRNWRTAVIKESFCGLRACMLD